MSKLRALIVAYWHVPTLHRGWRRVNQFIARHTVSLCKHVTDAYAFASFRRWPTLQHLTAIISFNRAYKSKPIAQFRGEVNSKCCNLLDCATKRESVCRD
ncbi:hypothetical protein KC19_1G142200 [Ceratodon purpureus]|uniref:Uncharacterized protein n=1 Tax=Ceratodon purpureus TaxID=3225 RepID=A0A8T0J833_CERPU|nr:hypothetical protein KC19_1G142200 [Ceratodon purpureus]